MSVYRESRRAAPVPRVVSALFLAFALSCVTTTPDLAPAPSARPEQATAQQPREAQPPVAKAIPERTEIHGYQRIDPYVWMKKKGTKEIEDYLTAENAYSSDWMNRTQELQATLYREMLGRVQETDSSAPYPSNGYEYYYRTEAGKQYRIECRRKLPDGMEEVLLDFNELGKDAKFISIVAMTVSDDSSLLAYGIDLTGFRQYTLRIKNLKTGALLPEIVERVRSAAWAADNKTLFYTVENDAKRSFRMFSHRLGTPVEKDRLVYEEKDERFSVHTYRSRDKAFVMMVLASRTTTEERFFDAKEPGGDFKMILPRQPDIEYEASPHGDSFLIVTNDKGRTKRLVQVPIANPEKGKWVELVPVRPDVMLEEVDVFRDFYVLSERAKGLSRLRGFDFKTGKETAFEMPEQDYYLSSAINAEDDTKEFRYNYMSMVTPLTVFARGMSTGTTRVVKVDPVPTYDASKYETRRLLATARDGTPIPISVAMKKGTLQDGSSGLYLRGYGAYGAPIDAYFLGNEISLLDRGVMVAWAHVRGGGEFGKPWHDAGRMMNKHNTFSDFIDAAETMLKEGWTRPERLAINGGSAGGLLIGAVLNMRPDLFHAALVEVPFVDVVNTMLDESLPLTVEEFEEWGNPKVKAEYDSIMGYSPYDNVKAQAYPAMLVRSSYNDSQVLYHEPAKWVAKLRATKTDHNPLLLRMEMDPAGHGGRSGRYDRLKDAAYYDSFILWELGIKK